MKRSISRLLSTLLVLCLALSLLPVTALAAENDDLYVVEAGYFSDGDEADNYLKVTDCGDGPIMYVIFGETVTDALLIHFTVDGGEYAIKVPTGFNHKIAYWSLSSTQTDYKKDTTWGNDGYMVLSSDSDAEKKPVIKGIYKTDSPDNLTGLTPIPGSENLTLIDGMGFQIVDFGFNALADDANKAINEGIGKVKAFYDESGNGTVSDSAANTMYAVFKANSGDESGGNAYTVKFKYGDTVVYTSENEITEATKGGYAYFSFHNREQTKSGDLKAGVYTVEVYLANDNTLLGSRELTIYETRYVIKDVSYAIEKIELDGELVVEGGDVIAPFPTPTPGESDGEIVDGPLGEVSGGLISGNITDNASANPVGLSNTPDEIAAVVVNEPMGVDAEVETDDTVVIPENCTLYMETLVIPAYMIAYVNQQNEIKLTVFHMEGETVPTVDLDGLKTVDSNDEITTATTSGGDYITIYTYTATKKEIEPTPTPTPTPSVSPSPTPTTNPGSGNTGSYNSGSSSSSDSSGSSSTTTSSPSTDTGTGTTTVEVTTSSTTSGTTASATVNNTNMNRAVNSVVTEAAKRDTAPVVEIEVTTAARATSLKVSLPAASLGTLAKADGSSLVITSNIAEVVLDHTALSALADNATGSTVTLDVAPVLSSTLTAAQQEIVGNAPVMDLTLVSNGAEIHDYNGGTLTISVPYVLMSGQIPDDIQVYHMDDLVLSPCVTIYGDNKVTFTTTHLSKYVIGDKSLAKPVFTDVANDAYYAAAVAWAKETGVTNGTGDGTTFGPADPVTRGDAVTFLWRAMGQPEPETTANPFADIRESKYYYKAVLWAAENGITDGTGDNLFSPDDSVLWEQMVTFIWRTEGKPGETGEGAYYADAINWIVEQNLLDGTDKTVMVGEDCPRADVVTLLYNDLAV